MRRDHWREDARCLGQPVGIFFPDMSLGEARWDSAKEVCRKCTVKRQCLKLVIKLPDDDDRYGVFGGYSPMDRRKLRDDIKRGINKDAL
jgi:hypothetical protein